jgi:hypothetical protein
MSMSRETLKRRSAAIDGEGRTELHTQHALHVDRVGRPVTNEGGPGEPFVTL